MLKTRPLCTGAESNLGDRVLGEVEKDTFIALPGKGGHSGLMTRKTVCPNPGRFGEGFWFNGAMVQGRGCCKDQDVCRACIPLIWPQVVS